MRLWNKLTERKEDFAPLGDPVRMYVCGVTPYDTTHLGHARTYVFFDVLRRVLRSLGHNVRYVQNITDVDDPLFQRAKELGVDYQSLAAANVDAFAADMVALHVLPPTVQPRAGGEINDMIAVIGELLDKGAAYVRDGTVFFRVASDPCYGELSRLSRPAMAALSAEHGNDLADPRKEDPLDFVLWQPSAADEPSWPSPWAAGRPGWHIECSTMAMKYLGAMIDIHGGGDDLIYPHHENEIAQSEASSGVRPFARFWLHTGMVRLSGIKMSKSLGNLVMVCDLRREFSAEAIRIYLLGHPYREPFDFDRERLVQAEAVASGLRVAATMASIGGGSGPDPLPYQRRFHAALEDDLNTPAAIDALGALAGQIRQATPNGAVARQAPVALRKMADLLGLSLAR